MNLNSVLHTIQVLYLLQTSGFIINTDFKDEKSLQKQYLEQFGYLKNPDLQADQSSDVIRDAILDFQQTWNLPQTGNVDEKTLELMRVPRCGNSDVDISHDSSRKKKHSRQKRFSILPYGGWRKTNLTYSVQNRPQQLTGSQVLSAFEHAFRAWAKVTPLRFKRVTSNPDIDILFASYEHGDGKFDGPGGTVAHTYYPAFGGDIHLDASEKWTLGTGTGTDLFQTAVHEIGHALGLGHTRSHTAVMYPYYQFLFPWKLGKDDIGGMQFLYGNPDSESSTSYLDFCANPSVDASTTNSKGEVFIFVGKYFLKVDDKGIAEGYPRLISEGMPELANNIDAAVHLPTLYAHRCRHSRPGHRKCAVIEERQTYMFKGDTYYLYNENDKFKGMGKISSEFPGMPSSINAAFTIDGSHVYFVKGRKYWRMERGKPIRSVDPGYPRILSEDFQGLPHHINAVVRSEIKTVKKYKKVYILFFFSGSKYYRITNFHFKVGQPIRLSARTIGPDWFNCPTRYNNNNKNIWPRRSRKMSDR